MKQRQTHASRERTIAFLTFIVGGFVNGSYVVIRLSTLIIGNGFANIYGSSRTDPKSFPSLWAALTIVSLTAIALIIIIVRERRKNQPFAREVVCAVLSALLAVLGWGYLAVA